jgi:hypothetical protein
VAYRDADLLDQSRDRSYRRDGTEKPAVTEPSLNCVPARLAGLGEEGGVVEHGCGAAHASGRRVVESWTTQSPQAATPIAFEVKLNIAEAAVSMAFKDDISLVTSLVCNPNEDRFTGIPWRCVRLCAGSALLPYPARL